MKPVCLFVLVGVIGLTSCAPGRKYVSTSIPTHPIYSVDPERMLLLSVYDVKKENYRDNKEALFQSIVDALLSRASAEVRDRIGKEAIPVYGVTPIYESHNRDSAIHAIMIDRSTSDAVVISHFDVFFNQTNVNVTKNEDGTKDREAYYDIVSRITYLWYDLDGLFKEVKLEISRFHSSRSVLSGLLAAGPNVVKQNDAALQLSEENLRQFLNQFLPGHEERMRIVFIRKEFASMKASIDAGNFERALEESLKLTSHADKKITAQAYYNCAVISERLQEYPQAYDYLQQAIWHFNLFEANEMLFDYRTFKR